VNGALVTPVISTDDSTSICSGATIMISADTNFNSDYAILFDGADDYIEEFIPSLPQSNSSRTLECWIKTNQPNNGVIANWGTPNTNERFGLLVLSGRLYFVGENNDFTGNITISDNSWHHVAATYDGTSLSLFVDGVLDFTTVTSFNTNGSFLEIGKRAYPQAGEYFAGSIDELRIWDVARTQSEIQSFMNDTVASNASGLVAYYKMNEGGGNVTYNDVSLVNVALINNPAWTTGRSVDVNYLWSPGGETTPFILVNQDGAYSVNVSNSSGCSVSSNVIYVTTHQPPIVSFTGNSICEGASDGVATVIADKQPLLNITTPVSLQFDGAKALFGPDIFVNPVIGDVVYINDNSSLFTGCDDYPSGSLIGKVALIDRGTCTFESKVYRAEQAGASGVIIVNNNSLPPFTMGAGNVFFPSIPVIMISMADGLILKNLIASNPTVSCNSVEQVYSYLWSNGDTTATSTNLVPGIYSATVNNQFGCAANINPVVYTDLILPYIDTISNLLVCGGDSVVLSASDHLYDALQFDGVDDRIALPHFERPQEMTVEAWIKTTSSDPANMIVGWGGPCSSAEFILFNGFLSYAEWDCSSFPSTLGSPVNDGQWHHVAVVRTNDVVDNISLYQDGVLVSTGTSNHSIVTTDLNIGAYIYNGVPGKFFNGSMDDVRIWNVARSETEIQSGMTGVDRFSPGLLAYYNFDYFADTAVYDQVTNTAQTINGPTWIHNDHNELYLWSTGETTSTIVAGAGTYTVTITNENGCSAFSAPVNITSIAPTILISGSTNICAGDTIQLTADSVAIINFASEVIAVSSEYGPHPFSFSASQALGLPNLYPAYGDIGFNWASLNPDDAREFIELRFNNISPINFIDIYETYKPGSVDTVYVKNPNTGLFEVIYTATPVVEPDVARILHITFPTTSFVVNEVRIAMNSSAVPDWNEIDAVSIGVLNNSYLWSTGETTQSIFVAVPDSYSVQVSNGICSSSLSLPVIVSDTCSGSVVFNLKVYLEGYASSFGAPVLPMAPALFYQGISLGDAVCDTVYLELHDQFSSFAIVETAVAVIDTGGNGVFNFTQNVLGGTYWLAVNHRSSIVTYSGMPFTVSTSNYYDFTISDTQSFGPNMKDIFGDGTAWALFSGDIFDANLFQEGHDGFIDIFDYLILDVDVQSGNAGYYITDLNGDGFVDIFDYLLFDPNVQSGVSSITPP